VSAQAILHDGRPCTEGAAASRALQYGDGVFRTMLWSDGAVADWPWHLDKLAADCAALRLRMPDAGLLADEVSTLAGGAARAVLKLIVARAGGGRGYRPAGEASERWLYRFDAPPPCEDAYRRGIRVVLSAVALSEQPLLAGVKHLNRLDQVLAARDCPADADEALMCDAAGYLVCGTRSNLFCVSGGQLLTPQLNRCGVAGIMRARILETCAALGVPARAAVLEPAALLAADEVFVSNALIGIWPVRALGERRWPAPGPTTVALMRALRHPLVPSDLS